MDIGKDILELVELFWIIRNQWNVPVLWLNLIMFNCTAGVPACIGSQGPFVTFHVTAIDVESYITAQIAFPVTIIGLLL